MKKMIATYRITTPMFCSGANQQEAELRAASFKGALRFWYRAIALAEKKTVAEVRNAEDALFGSTRTGQARVLMSLRVLESQPTLKCNEMLGLGRRYLAGMGLTKPEGRTKREAIGAGTRFEVSIIVKDSQETGLLRDALIAMGLFGGMGSRSRRGFGSLTLETITGDCTIPWTAPQSVDAIKAVVEDILHRYSFPKSNPPYTAISQGTRIVLIPAQDPRSSALDIHERMGKSFVHYRSYGQKQGGRHWVGQVEALQLFDDDHDDMLAVAQGRRPSNLRAPRRVAFGLPHNYFFRSIEKFAKVEPNGATRRASPLFFHVHEVPQSAPIGMISFLPARFLLDPEVVVSPKGRNDPPLKLPKPDEFWQPIHEFFDRVLAPGGGELCESFPGAINIEVKP